jgi:pimeloyl-ACP methyl ester carboxylesterase
MPDVSIRGRKLAYEVRPANYDKGALAVVFIHGSGGDREDWQGQLDGLSDKATLIALELPGHGLSEPPGESTVPAYSQWVVDFVQAISLEKVMLVGCSLGSAITQWVALSPPAWLSAIGLVGAGARLKVHPALLDGLLSDAQKALDGLADFALSPSSGKALHELIADKFLHTSPKLVHGDLSACNEFDIMERVGQISLPTLILVGEDDRLTPVKYSRFLHDGIRGSKLEVIAGAGHMAMVEKPEEFNKLLAEFFAELK